jgi:hypothetical protein
VAEHSLQVPMPYSPLLLNYLYILWRPFFARVDVNHARVYSRMLTKVLLLPWQRGWLKARLENNFCLF